MPLYTVHPIQSPDLARANIVYLSSSEHLSTTHFVVVNEIPFFFSIDQNLSKNSVCLNKAQREACSLTVGSSANLSFIEKTNLDQIKLIRIELMLVNLGKRSVDRSLLVDFFKKTYIGFPFSLNQVFYLVTPDLTLRGTVNEIQNVNVVHGNNLRMVSTQNNSDFNEFDMNRKQVNFQSSGNIQNAKDSKNEFNLKKRFDSINLRGDNFEFRDLNDQQNATYPGFNSSLFGVVAPQTTVHFSSFNDQLSLTGSDGPLLSDSLDLSELGIGGLQKEFSVMFRRAFVQRCFDSETVARLGLPHVKGILLHGPPGTGKTLIARQIGKLLRANPPKIVSGPEVLSKYVGESEENVRALFVDAEAEFKKLGDKSSLHIIIFDELDAVFRKRGMQQSGVGDQVVNQLLSKMDGVDALNNILVIGMTNRPDIIDKALLRPGRFEIHIEISLPTKEGRAEILKIHTAKMRKHNVLDKKVDIDELARLSRNFTGAEIQALVKSAASFALERAVQGKKNQNYGSEASNFDNFTEEQFRPSLGLKNKFEHEKEPDRYSGNAKIYDRNPQHSDYATKDGLPDILTDNGNVTVTMNDFMRALDEIVPALGFDAKEFTLYTKTFHNLRTFQNGLQLIENTVKKLRQTTAYTTASILLHGLPGTGKTTLAVKAAITSKSPHIKMITPKHLVGLSENEKVNYIKEIFTNAYRSTESFIILDEIETLIDFVSIGPRFSNSVLQAIKIFTKNCDKNKVIVIGTTSDLALTEEIGILQTFQFTYKVEEITTNDLESMGDSFQDIKIQLPAPIKTILSGGTTTNSKI